MMGCTETEVAKKVKLLREHYMAAKFLFSDGNYRRINKANSLLHKARKVFGYSPHTNEADVYRALKTAWNKLNGNRKSIPD